MTPAAFTRRRRRICGLFWLRTSPYGEARGHGRGSDRLDEIAAALAIVLPPDRMPTNTGAAAVFRY